MFFRKNPNFDKELSAEEAFRQGMKTGPAAAIKSSVEQVAPTGATGNYADSIEVNELPDGSIVVATTDFAGHIVEWGSVNNPAYAPLRRGVRAAGARLDEK